MKGGATDGRKLWPSLTVARQANRVLTKIGRPSRAEADIVDVEIAGHPAGMRRVDERHSRPRWPGPAGRTLSKRWIWYWVASARLRPSALTASPMQRGKVRSNTDRRPSGLMPSRNSLPA